jgi:Pyridoxamine 5'-phosphate oxidase
MESGDNSMTDQEPVEVTNLDRFGNAALPWSRPRDILAAGPLWPETIFFLGTTKPDGRPHAAGLGILWIDGDLYFTSGPGTRKARNLAANPACTVSGRLEGIDVVFEGEASQVTDRPTLEQAAGIYREAGWPAEVEGDAFTAPFSAPSEPPPPYNLYRFRFHTAFGVASAEPHGATRWRFER